MALTCVIQPSVTDAEICCSNNMASNSLMEVTNVPYKIYEELTCNDNTRKDQIDKTEIFSNMQMDITKPLGTILSLNTYNKENLKIDETVFGDNNTMIFHDVSMEMTKAVLSKNEEFPETNICKSFNNTNTYKSSVSKDVCSEKNENIYTCFNQETASYKSIKLTEAVPAPLYHQRTLQAHDVQLTNKNIYKDYKNDRTEIFNNESMEITKSVNIHHSNINKSLKINETAPEYNKTILFHDGSVEMTAAVSSKNRYEITQPIACKSVPEEVTLREKSSNNSIFNEKTKLLCKSMEFTEVVPITLHDEKKSNITYTVQSFSQTLPKTTLLPVKESTRIIHAESVVNKTIQDTSMEITAAVPSTSQFMQDLKYAETVVNKTIQDTSMEITAAVPSTLQFMQDSKSNKTENLIISKNDEYQRATTNNTPTEANKSTTKKICTNARKDLEENIRHDELSNLVTRSSPDKLSHLSNTNFEKISSENKISNACEKRKRFKESQTFFRKIEFSPEKKKLFRRTDTDCDSENNEHFVKSVTEPTQISGLNLKDSLYESNEDNFLRTLSYFENDCEELNSIQPPSFVGLDSEEEISPQTFQQTTNTSINNILNCQTEEQKNIENTQIPIKIVEDYNESIKNISEDSLVINANNENSTTTQNINYYTTSIVKEIEETHINRVNKREHIRERIYKDLNLQNDNKEKEQYQNKLRQEPEKCSDRFENTAVAIENLTDNSKKCEKNLSEIKQNVEECTSIINDTKDENLTEEHLFSTLVQQLELHTRFVRYKYIFILLKF
ncbi:hypothetical protein PUN28_002468 [Cardiocondyla obscurior]|uniref:Uncharacterized protein n=1 Tax=Cardiocondyla obscurior TaxID=286306 RepID=A0AAW2GUA1_9HYME